MIIIVYVHKTFVELRVDSIHGHFYILNGAIQREDLLNVFLGYIPCQLSNMNFCGLWCGTALFTLWGFIPLGTIPAATAV